MTPLVTIEHFLSQNWYEGFYKCFDALEQVVGRVAVALDDEMHRADAIALERITEDDIAKLLLCAKLRKARRLQERITG